MKIVKLIVLLVIVMMLISCVGINKTINIHPDYVGKTINKKTLLIQSVENDSLFLGLTGGLDDDVRIGKPKELFVKLMKDDLAWRIYQNSTFKKVKYQAVEDSYKYDYSLKLKNISVHLIDTGEVTPIVKADFSNSLTKYMKLCVFCEFEITDNHNNEIVLSGNISGLEGSYYDLFRMKNKRVKKRMNKLLTKREWNNAIKDLGFNLIADTPFYKEKKNNKYYNFE